MCTRRVLPLTLEFANCVLLNPAGSSAPAFAFVFLVLDCRGSVHWRLVDCVAICVTYRMGLSRLRTPSASRKEIPRRTCATGKGTCSNRSDVVVH